MRISLCRLGKLEKRDYICDCTDLNGLREDVSPNPKSMQLFFTGVSLGFFCFIFYFIFFKFFLFLFSGLCLHVRP